MTTPANRTHALYRFYADDGRLLYVGITSNPGQRFGEHAKDKPWWHEVRGISVETYADRTAVLAAEKRAIAVEHPVHNRIRAGLGRVNGATPTTVADRPSPRRRGQPLVWVCDACKHPVADKQGYIHVDHAEVWHVESFWREKEERDAQQRLTDPSAGRFVNLADMLEWPDEARWQVHHAACDPKPESNDYHFDVARARTHAHLLDWTAHFLESKDWIKYTDWDRLIRRMAAVDA